MKQILMNGAAPFLPEEIITNILKRLPVKSLMRFQCVCKHWKNLFKTPSFIADHLRFSNNKNPAFLFFLNYGLDPLNLRLLDCEMQVRDIQKPPLFDSLPCVSVRIIGSSNGLLCVAIHRPSVCPHSLLLWNPATRDVREVPSSTNINSHVYSVVGFGFSSFINDYKIVRVYDAGMICGAEVYSLSRDAWKEIEFENLEDVTLFRENVSCNGAIFWHGSKPGEEEEEEEDEEEEEGERVIVSFDIRKEVFTLIPWPALPNDPCFNLTVYEDKLAILTEHGIEGSSNIDMWVLEEDIGSSGERWSWTKKFTNNSSPWELSPGIIWNNEIVLSGSEIECETERNEPRRGICLFNITSNEFKMLNITNINFGVIFSIMLRALYQLSTSTTLKNLDFKGFIIILQIFLV